MRRDERSLSPFARGEGPRQRETKFKAIVLGGPPLLRGNYILAERWQVESQAWWDHASGMNVGVIVQCTNALQHFRYPNSVNAAISQHFRVDPMDVEHRQLMLNEALPSIEACLKEGKDVLFHCEWSVHRGPIVAAAATWRLTGKSADVPQRAYKNLATINKMREKMV